MVDPTNQQELLAALDASARSVGGGIAIARKGAWRQIWRACFRAGLHTQRQRHELVSAHHQINRRRLEHRSEPFTARKLTL